jgi:small GTP-binding protein
LKLSSNQVSILSPLNRLKKLELLVLNDNNISQLPIELVQLGMDIKWEYDYSNDMFLSGNPLEIPPVEIVKQGTAAVLNYFKELQNQTVRLLHSKLLIVGSGEVGKTTLMKKLKDNSFQVEVGKEETTHGINIVLWELQCPFTGGDFEKVNINFWDFGGQEIYHATHQFFLTKRSLYLFVWEAREEEIRSFDYWLNIIKLLSAESPVIVVMNKADIRGKHIDEASFKDKFKNIVTFLQVSCVTGQGIGELTGQIRTSLGNMKHLRDKLPKVWMDIRDDLKMEEKDYINLEEYFAICKKHYLDEERAEFLSHYLHDLGVILHYRHDKLLENIVILSPEWATEAVYKLIDTREIFENKGRFRFDDLKTYWDLTKFPREKHAQLVRLMEKFELCFPIAGSDIHIVPELLPAQRPSLDFEKYKKPDNLHFEYLYDFMPEGIITRFISRLYFLIKDDHFWKNGVELRFEDSTALVISELLNKKMKISVTGSHKRELLAITRNDFEHIHRTLNMEKNKHYDEMIPCGCSECLELEEPHLYTYETLKKYTYKRVLLIRCPMSIKEVSIGKLLKGMKPPKPKKDLLKTLITTAHHLQGISKTIKADEDSRNGFIALLLSIHGFYVKDQTRRGRSASGKSLGELDILIEKPGSEAESVIEAFILKSFDRTVIDNHVTKLFGYDPSGLKRNFIVVYSEASDFLSLWKKYLAHLPGIDLKKYKFTEGPQEEKTKFTDIKLARTRHLREGELTEVYHIFINMNI